MIKNKILITEEPKSKPKPEPKQTAGKLDPDLLTPEIFEEIIKVREYGINKYPNGGIDNWKEVSPRDFAKAIWRHALRLVLWRETHDKDSGLCHASHIACNVMFWLHLILNKYDNSKKVLFHFEKIGDINDMPES